MSFVPLKPLIPLKVKIIGGILSVVLVGVASFFVKPKQEPLQTPQEPLATGLPEPGATPEPNFELPSSPTDVFPGPILSVKEFAQRYKGFDLAKFMKTAQPIERFPERYAWLVRFSHASYIKTGDRELIWRHEANGEEGDPINPQACTSLRGENLDLLGFYGRGTVKFFQGPEATSLITVLHNNHYLLIHNDISQWDDNKAHGDVLMTVLYYKKTTFGKIEYQGQQDRWKNGFFSTDPGDCGYSP